MENKKVKKSKGTKRKFAWQKEKQPAKELVDYFPRDTPKEDYSFNLATVDRRGSMLNKKRKKEKTQKTNGEEDETITMDKQENSELSRVKAPKFRVGDLVLLCICEIRKDYMIATYTRNIKAMIHKTYAGLNEEQSFEQMFKLGDFVPGAIVSPGNDIQLSKGYINKKVLISIDPKIVNAGLNISNIKTGMDVWGQLVRDMETDSYSVDFRLETEAIDNINNQLDRDFEDDFNQGGEEGEDDEEEMDDQEEPEDIEMEEEQEDEEEPEEPEDEDDDELEGGPEIEDLDFLKPKSGKQQNTRPVTKRTVMVDSNINISFSESEADLSKTHQLGSYYFFKVMKINYIKESDDFKMTVSLNPENAIQTVKECEFKFLKPGFLFKSEVTRELLNGSEVAFGGNIGGIFIDHMKKGNTSLSRVIHVGANYASLSSLKHITYLHIPDIKSKLELQGKTYENVAVDKKVFGNSFQLTLDNIKCFLHQIQTDGTKYEAHDIIPNIRIKEYNFFDNRPILTSKEENLITGLSWENIEIGQFLDAEIKDIQKDYIYLEVNHFISGKLKREHITNFPLAKIPSKFKLGMKINVRVFELERNTKKLQFTMKENYTDPNLRLVSEINDIKEGHELTVIYIGNNLFKHCGNIVGRLINKTNEEFKLYKPYNFKVYKVLYNTKKIFFTNSTNIWLPGVGDFDSQVRKNQVLSTIIKFLNQNNKELSELKSQKSIVGHVCNFKIIKPNKIVKLLLAKDVDTTLIQDNLESITKKFLIIKFNSFCNEKMNKGKNAYGYGFCPVEMVSDFYQEKIFNHLIKTKDMEVKMLVLFHDTEKRVLFASAKESLISDNQILNTIPKAIDQIEGEYHYRGYVSKVIPNTGISVKFFDNNKIFTRFSKNFENFTEGQTILGRYIKTDKKTKLDLNIYRGQSIEAIESESTLYLNNVVTELAKIVDFEESMNYMRENIKFGAKVEGKVGLIKDYGVLVSFTEFSQYTGFLRNEHMEMQNEDYRVGEKMQCKVIDLDFINGIVYLTDKSSNNDNLKAKSKSTNNVTHYYNQNKNTSHQFVVDIIHDNYISVSLQDNSLIKAILPSNLFNFNYESSNLSETIKIGSTIKSKIVNYNEKLNKLILNFPLKISQKLVEAKRAPKNVVKLGNTIIGRINGVKGTFIYVYIDKHTLGRIHFTNFKGDIDEIKEKLAKKASTNGNTDNEEKDNANNVDNEDNLDRKQSNLSTFSAVDEELKISCKIIHIEEKEGVKVKICDLTTHQTDSNSNGFSSRIVVSEQLDFSGEVANTGIISKVDPNNKSPLKIEYGNNQKVGIVYNNISIDIMEKKNLGMSLFEAFKVGEEIKFYARKSGDGEEFYLKPYSQVKKQKSFEIGNKTLIRILKSLPGKGLVVSISDRISGFVDITDISDELLSNPLNLYKVGSIVLGRAISFDTNISKYIISLRRSVTSDEYYNIILSGSTLQYKNKFSSFEQIGDYRNKVMKYGLDNAIDQNLVCIGYVINSSEKGVFIKISKDSTVRVGLKEITDESTSKPYLLYQPSQLVICRITGITKNNDKINKINGSLRESVIKYNLTLKMKDLKLNNFYHCMVMSEDPKKYNVNIVGSTFNGVLKKKFCNPKTEIKDKAIVILQLAVMDKEIRPFVLKFSNMDFEEEGFEYNLLVNRVNQDFLEKNRIFTELFENVKQINEKQLQDEINNELKEIEKDASRIDFEEMLDKKVSAADSDDEEDRDREDEELAEELENEDDMEEDGDDDGVIFDMGMKSDFLNKKEIPSKIETENIEDMDIDEGEEEEEEEEDENEDNKDPNLTNSKKRERNNIKQELKLRQKEKEEGLNNYLENPQSMQDYEKLILSDLNSSINWVKYASYILDKMGLNSCQKIFERAIKTIDIANLKEKLNIWIAYMNLMHTYGTMDTFKEIVERALTFNDKKAVYKHLIGMYTQAKKFGYALEIYKICLKTYFSDVELYKGFIEFLFEVQKNGITINEIDKSTFIKPKEGLNRAMQSVNKSKHVELLIKYANSQYKYNHLEEARNTFETLLKNHPKRSDLWLVYVDKELKFGNIEKARMIFEKIFTIDFKVKVLKAVVKRYLEVEVKYGTPKSVESAKILAQNLIMQKMQQISETEGDKIQTEEVNQVGDEEIDMDMD